MNVREQNETVANSTETEEPLYEGSKILKVLLFVLIVSFVLKHNLSKAAWADLRLLSTLLWERCKKTFHSVYKTKLSTREYFGTQEPTKFNYCGNCFTQVEDRCRKAGCRGAAVSSFYISILRKNKGPLQRFGIFKVTEESKGADQKWSLKHNT